MADSVDTAVIFSGSRRKIYRFTNVSDGTGESAVIKIDKSTLTGPDGTEPSKLVIEEISWSIQGFTSVRIFFDHDTDDEAIILGAGSGYMNFGPGIQDPASTGGTGDILFTTANTTSGNTYSVTMVVRLKD